MPIDVKFRPIPASRPLPGRFSSGEEIIHDLLNALSSREDDARLIELFRRIRPSAFTVPHPRDIAVLGPDSEPMPLAVNRPDDPNGILLSGLIHPRLTEKLSALLDACRAQGLDVMLWEGYRDPARQDDLFARGGVTKARAGRSWHNYGLAADVVFTKGNGTPSWDARHDWAAIGRIGKSLGLTWGGDFKRIKDLGHFEWHPGISINDALVTAGEGGWKAVWRSVE